MDLEATYKRSHQPVFTAPHTAMRDVALLPSKHGVGSNRRPPRHGAEGGMAFYSAGMLALVIGIETRGPRVLDCGEDLGGPPVTNIVRDGSLGLVYYRRSWPSSSR